MENYYQSILTPASITMTLFIGSASSAYFVASLYLPQQFSYPSLSVSVIIGHQHSIGNDQ